MSQTLVTIGQIVKPHGLHGEVVVAVLSDVPGRFEPGAAVVVGGAPTHIEASRPHQGRMLVRFAGIADRNQAESLRGLDVEADELDVTNHDTYFAHELVGMRVVDAHGADLGEVEALIELPAAAAYDLLEVKRADGTTWLLPAVDAYVDVVELEAGAALRLIDPPDGLLDLDAGSR